MFKMLSNGIKIVSNGKLAFNLKKKDNNFLVVVMGLCNVRPT
jgi:hypothetical protein